MRPVKEQLLELIALLEAGIDFAEDDISVAPAEEILRRSDPIEQRARGTDSLPSPTASWCTPGSRWPSWDGRTSARAACLTGCWNRIGPSSPTIPGTTRDLVSEVAVTRRNPGEVRRHGWNSAGQDLVETLGIERSYQAMADADLTLVVVDLAAPVEPDGSRR